MLALAILTIGLFALLGMQISVIKGNAASKKISSGVFLTEAKIEELKETGFASLSAGTFQDPNNPVNETGETGGIFTRYWEVTDNYASSADMMKVTVTVTWPDQNVNHSVSLDTVLSRY